jgi:hypothetical protein
MNNKDRIYNKKKSDKYYLLKKGTSSRQKKFRQICPRVRAIPQIGQRNSTLQTLHPKLLDSM